MRRREPDSTAVIRRVRPLVYRIARSLPAGRNVVRRNNDLAATRHEIWVETPPEAVEEAGKTRRLLVGGRAPVPARCGACRTGMSRARAAAIARRRCATRPSSVAT